jgi:hypothetical protein
MIDPIVSEVERFVEAMFFRNKYFGAIGKVVVGTPFRLSVTKSSNARIPPLVLFLLSCEV